MMVPLSRKIPEIISEKHSISADRLDAEVMRGHQTRKQTVNLWQAVTSGSVSYDTLKNYNYLYMRVESQAKQEHYRKTADPGMRI